MKMSSDTKKGIIITVLGVGLAWLLVYIANKERKEDQGEVSAHIITDESIMVAYKAYKSGLDSGESKEALAEINNELKSEYGLSVDYRPMKNKFVVYDKKGKLLKEIDG